MGIDVVDAILESGRRRLQPRFKVVVVFDPQALPIEIEGFRDGYNDRIEAMSVEDAKQLRDALSETLEAMGVE